MKIALIKSKVLAVIIMLLCASMTEAQKRTVSGTVHDEEGVGLPGATVLEQGTMNGTVTSIDGAFALDVSEGATLEISFIGFATKAIEVRNEISFEVSMIPDFATLSEVVVVGYAEQKKESLTGAIEQVTSEVFTDRAVTNPALSLQGQSPGLVVSRSSARPGNEDIQLQIRGATSVNGGDPLVLIDGVPVIGLREFYDMNPDDIASISVLKDGSAAIYGTRAANGVILVTTKRGESGTPKLKYSNNFRLGTPGIRPPTPSMQEYAQLWLDADDEDQIGFYWAWASRENLERMAAGEEGIYNTSFYGDIYVGNYDRYEDLFGYNFSQQHNLSLSGSSDNSAFRASMQYADNTGALKTAYDGKKTYNFRLNYDIDVTDRLKVETGMNYQRGVTSGPSSGLDLTAVSQDPPLFPAMNPYGQWYANFGIIGDRNSVAATTDGGREDGVEDLMKVNLALNYQIIDGLDLRLTGSFNKRDRREDVYRLSVQAYEWNGSPALDMINSNPFYSIRGFDRTYQNYGSFLNYSRLFGKAHSIKATIGINADKQIDQSFYAERGGFVDQGVYDFNLAPDIDQATSGGQSDWGLYGYIARINYEYNGKYLVELLGRRDGSSRFDEGFKWSNFGGFSLGWIISDEDFFQDIGFINFLKVRGGYGETGNQAGIGSYDFVSGISTNSIPFGFNGGLQATARVNGISSDVRSWERVSQENIGLDVMFLDNKFSANVDFFRKVNDGMLINPNVPDVIGGEAPTANIGVLETKGWEVALSYRSQIGNLNFSMTANMSNTVNEVVRFEGANSTIPGLVNSPGTEAPTWSEGYPINSYFLYQTNGLFANQSEVDAFYDQYPGGTVPNQFDPEASLRPGDIIKIDTNGDGVIDMEDVVFAADASPHYVYGINLTANYKGFDITAFFQGVLNQNVLRSGYLSMPFYEEWTNQPTSFLGKTWSEDNQEAEFPRLTTNEIRSDYNWEYNDFALQNNRYIRLKNLVVGYALPQALIQKVRLEKVRFYFAGNDLFELTSIKDGFDPEYGESTQSIYPFQRTWSAGLDVTF